MRVRESKNAVYTLLLIRHGDVVSVIQERYIRLALCLRRVTKLGIRLQAAAREAMKWCDDRVHAQCEDALKASDSGG